MHKEIQTQIDTKPISIKNLNINFEQKSIYKDFSIDFQENKITAILAPSGAGKTTLLKAISKQEKKILIFVSKSKIVALENSF